MEQYIPYSLLCDLFSRNLETYLHKQLNRSCQWAYLPTKFERCPPMFRRIRGSLCVHMSDMSLGQGRFFFMGEQSCHHIFRLSAREEKRLLNSLLPQQWYRIRISFCEYMSDTSKGTIEKAKPKKYFPLLLACQKAWLDSLSLYPCCPKNIVLLRDYLNLCIFLCFTLIIIYVIFNVD